MKALLEIKRPIPGIAIFLLATIFIAEDAAAQYSQYKRKNLLFLRKWDFVRNMDSLVEDRTHNDGVLSHRAMVKNTGYKPFTERYYKEYNNFCNVGHREMVEYFYLLKNYPERFWWPNPNQVWALTEPIQKKKRYMDELRKNPPKRVPYIYNPIHSSTEPVKIHQNPFDESLLTNLPKAPLSSEKPSAFPYPATKTIAAETNKKVNPPSEKKHTILLQDIPQPHKVTAPTPKQPLQLLFDIAKDAFEKRNYPKAKNLFAQILARNPNSPQTLFAHGLSTFYSGEYQQSLHDFKKCDDASLPNKILMHPRDFQYHMKKLEKHVEQNPNDRNSRELHFHLSRISPKTPAPIQQ